MKEERTANLTSKPITEFTPSDTIYAVRLVRDHPYTFFGQFVQFKRGLVTMTGKLINPSWGDPRDFGASSRDGTVTITVLLRRCYLWGQGPKDSWARCHWFHNPNKSAD